MKKAGYGSGNNVKLGCYSTDDNKSNEAMNGKHGQPRTLMQTHRMNSTAPKIKGHHFNAPRSKKTGKAFGKKGIIKGY